MKKELRVLETFSGIGAPRKALERGGYNYTIVDSIEIDPYPVKSYNAVYGDETEPKDIAQWYRTKEELGEIDLLWNSSPCQDFSVAGNGAGGAEGSGTRSSLIYEVLRITKEFMPRYVIWENVKGLTTKKHRPVLDDYIEQLELLGYKSYWQVLNAKDYGIPQNRERVFVVSILGDEEFIFPEPQELLLKLKDMLEDVVDEKYYLTDQAVERVRRHNNKIAKNDTPDVSCTLHAGYYKGGGRDQQYVREEPRCIQVGELDIKGMDCVKRVYSKEGISPALTTMQGGNRQPKVAEVKEPCIVASRGRYNADGSTSQNYEFNETGCTNTITTIQKDNLVVEPKIVDIKSSEKFARPQPQNGVVNTIITTSKFGIDEIDRIRRLTPKECWRLMGFDDIDFDKAQQAGLSNTQLYKQAGNSVVVNVIEAIFKKLLTDYQ